MATKNLGLDIRRDSVTGVVVENTLQGSRVTGFARTEITGGDVADDAALPQMIHELLEKLEIGDGVSDFKCFASLPPEYVSIRNIHVPFEGSRQIRSILPFELEPLLPFPVEDIVLDFQVVKTPGLADGSDLLVMGGDRKQLDSSSSSLGAVGIMPESVTMAGYPSALSLARFADFEGDFVFADFSGGRCTIYFILSGMIGFVRSFSLAGEPGREIRRSILGFREDSGLEFKPVRVVWTGFAEGVDVVLDSIGTETGLAVTSGDLLSYTGITIANGIKLSWKPTLYDNGLALAWAGITGTKCVKFQERTFAAGKYFERYRERLTGTAVLASLLLILLGCQFFLNIHRDGNRIEELNHKINALYSETFPGSRKVRQPYETMRGKVAALKKEAEFAAGGEEHARVIDIMNDISRALPGKLDIEFTKFAMAKGSVKISGLADTFSTVDEMKGRLEKIPYFKQVVIGSSTKDKSGKLFRFRLIIDL